MLSKGKQLVIKKYKVHWLKKPRLSDFLMTTKIDKVKPIVLILSFPLLDNVKLRFSSLSELINVVLDYDSLRVLKAFDTLNTTEIIVF